MNSPCLSAGGLRFLGLLVPAVGLGLPSEDRQACWPVRARPQRGYHVPHQLRRDGRVGASYTARSLGAPAACRRRHALTRRRTRSGSWPSHRRVSHRLRRPFVTQPQRRFICIHPSRLSLTRLAWMVQARLGPHPSAFARHVTGAALRGPGTDMGTNRGRGDSATGHSSGATSCRTPVAVHGIERLSSSMKPASPSFNMQFIIV